VWQLNNRSDIFAATGSTGVLAPLESQEKMIQQFLVKQSRSNIIIILLAWDRLGLVSYCRVISFDLWLQ
jgi:hypothetical protein